MAIVTSKEVYRKCLTEPWAVGGFIGYDLEIMQAAIEAGIDEQAPIMVQASCRVIDYAGADRLYAMAQAFSQRVWCAGDPAFRPRRQRGTLQALH